MTTANASTCPLVHRPQASREPLAPELMNEIFEDVKDMGVLIGKGGIYGQVTYPTPRFLTSGWMWSKI